MHQTATRPALRWAPSYEQEVVILFGMLLPYVESIATIERSTGDFPDCVATTPDGRSLRIEFEVRASDFAQHGHDAAGCDLIVCWVDDWPDSPVPVLSLRDVVRQHAPWAVQQPERYGGAAATWDERSFCSRATPAGLAMLEGVKGVVARHGRAFSLVYGSGDTEPTVDVRLLLGGSGTIYCVFARGRVDVDFTRLSNQGLAGELRERLAPLSEKARTRSWTALPGDTEERRQVLLATLEWLGEALEKG